MYVRTCVCLCENDHLFNFYYIYPYIKNKLCEQIILLTVNIINVANVMNYYLY